MNRLLFLANRNVSSHISSLFSHVFTPLLCITLLSCSTQNQDEELSKIKSTLAHYRDSSLIYADPPTGDYEDLAKGKFLVQDSAKLALVKKYREELQPMILQYIDSSYEFVYLAAYLKYDAAIPILKEKLLHDQTVPAFYGWEHDPDSLSNPNDKRNEQLGDHEHPYQMACIAAIEYISGRVLSKTITTTADEKLQLENEAKSCVADSIDSKNFSRHCKAYWLLCKFEDRLPQSE